eukprot:scaffold24048_cov194-Amphora_coffeaeformis.AAC.3
MSKVQYVRAGACVQGQSLSNQLTECALEFSDCPTGTTFWSSHQVADALGSPAAACLKADATKQLLAVRCASAPDATTTTGACLVEDFQAIDIYHCAVSREGCAPGDEYLASSLTSSRGDITCQLCGLDASMDADLSDVTDVTLLDRFRGASEDQKLEAVGIAGIVLGLVIGCGLLLSLQRLCRSCCGGRRKKCNDEIIGVSKASARTMADGMDESSNNNNNNNKQPVWADTTAATEEEENKIV